MGARREMLLQEEVLPSGQGGNGGAAAMGSGAGCQPSSLAVRGRMARGRGRRWSALLKGLRT